MMLSQAEGEQVLTRQDPHQLWFYVFCEKGGDHSRKAGRVTNEEEKEEGGERKEERGETKEEQPKDEGGRDQFSGGLLKEKHLTRKNHHESAQ